VESEPAEPDLTEIASENISEELAAEPPQPVPLQDVWNVQRMENPQSQEEEPGPPLDLDSVLSGGAAFSNEPAQTNEPEVLSQRNNGPMEPDNPSIALYPAPDSSRAPVEILPPSRPRPSRTQVAPARPPVQRQPENRTASHQVTESSAVDTAIGPLPSDLWSLLGQQPPVNANQRDVQRQTAIRSSPAEASRDQKAFLHEYSVAPVERVDQTTLSPTMLQRQAASEAPATTVTVQQQEPVSQDEKKDQGEPDLQDLAQKVYVEIRRRLATESERTHRYI
jgi:hypothetical protein